MLLYLLPLFPDCKLLPYSTKSDPEIVSTEPKKFQHSSFCIKIWTHSFAWIHFTVDEEITDNTAGISFFMFLLELSHCHEDSPRERQVELLWDLAIKCGQKLQQILPVVPYI